MRTDRSGDVAHPGTLPAPQVTLAAACRILAMEGHGAGLAGQVSARATDATMHTIALGFGLEEIEPDDVIEVDHDLRVVRGRGGPNPATRFHGWIYAQRPDVRAIVHTHPPALSAFSMLGIALPIAHMDACMFHDDCGFLARWPGVPTGDDEGAVISAALGPRSCAILAGHGYVATGASLEEAVYRAVFLERAAARCLRALPCGPLRPLDDAEAAGARAFLMQRSIVDGTFAYWRRRSDRVHREAGAVDAIATVLQAPDRIDSRSAMPTDDPSKRGDRP